MARDNNITEGRKDPGELNEEAYQFPDGGIIPSIMDYTMSQAPRPNRPLALAGALTMTSHMMGRRYIAEDGTSPNIYLIALANSGCGKDFPRKVNRNIAVELGMVGTVCDSFASGGGLEDSVLMNTRVLAQYDEMDTLFRAMKADKSGSSEPMSAMMLSLYGDSCSSHSRRQLSAASNAKSQIPAYCIRPSLSIFGTAIPKQFFASMSDRMLTNGLFARCILIPTGDRPALNEATYRPFSASLVRYLQDFAGCTADPVTGRVSAPLMKADEKPMLVTVPFDEDVRPFVKESGEEYDAAWNRTESDAERALLARAQEKVIKLSLVFAVSENHVHPVIGIRHLFRARQIVNFSNRKSMYLASMYCADSEFHDLQLRALRKIPEEGILHNKLLKNLHLPASQFGELMDTLVLSGEVVRLSGTSDRNPLYKVSNDD